MLFKFARKFTHIVANEKFFAPLEDDNSIITENFFTHSG